MQRYWRWRARLRRLGASTLLRPSRFLTGGLIGVAMAMLVIHFLNSQLRPVMAELATAQVQNDMTIVIDDVVAREVAQGHLAYDDIIRLETDSAGAVTALKSDLTQVNLLRSDILTALVDAVDQKNVLDMGIPLGNLTGINLLSGRGPEIPVKVLTAGSADAVYDNAFTDAGINQTRHQVMLYVTVPVRILLPGYTTQTSVSAQVCVAETIIVGQVPETYLQLGP